MGRVTTQTDAAPPPSTPIRHSSHPHDLHPIPSHYPRNPAGLCSACKLPSSGTMYSCPPCNFLLHHSCAELPQLITHPGHDSCNLSLLTISSYPGGRFRCDACGRFGDGWSYHCGGCDYDLHVRCSIKPLKIRHRAHPCDLKLTFQNPYADGNGFSCDICRMIGEKQWLYRCDSCQFDVHLDCSASQAQQILQHQRSLPDNSQNHIQLLHSASTGGMNRNRYQYQGPLINPAGGFNGSVPYSNQQYVIQNNPRGTGGGFGSNLLTAAAGGAVEGVMQQLAQSAVQEVVSLDDGSSY